MKVPGLLKDDSQQPYNPHQVTQLSNKRTWRLKKSTKTEDEIQEQQKQYENLEFSPKKTSSRRPRNKPGVQQEFVFVDLSPKKKETSTSTTTTATKPQQDESVKNHKKQGRVSRLFRLSNSQSDSKSAELLPCSVLTYQQSRPLSPSTAPQTLVSRPQLAAVATRSYSQQQRERSNSSASLVMTISDDGRAVLQPQHQQVQQQQPLSACSSTSDLFSLGRNTSARHSFYSRSPIPSPQRMESPLPQERFPPGVPHNIPKYSLSDSDNDNDSESESDALRAFSRAVKHTRKRAGTNASQSSLHKTLTRNHSLTSISSSKNPRVSPSRATLARQGASGSGLVTPNSTTTFVYNDGTTSSASYFDESVKVHKPRAFLHKKTASISVLGPPLEIGGDNVLDTDGSESAFEIEESMRFGTSNISGLTDFNSAPTAFGLPGIGETNTQSSKIDADDLFDFNAFVNYDSHEF